jgi:iron(III) transport system substrate-binding protein
VKRLSAILFFSSLSFFAISSSWAQSLDKIVEAAKKEGQVRLGLTLRWEVGGKPSGKKLAEAFQARYPFIKVSLERVGGTRERERVISELAAGRVSYDVTVLTVTQTSTAVRANLAERVNWHQLGIQRHDISPQELGVNYQYGVFGIAYNKKLIPDEVGSKLTWDDCTDPKWKTKVAANDSPVHLEILWQPHAWGRDKTLEHARKLVANQTIFERSLEESLTKVALGEYLLSCGNVHRNYVEYTTHKDPAALGFTVPGPAPATSRGVVYIPRGASHPNAAKLWILWSFSEEAQKILDEVDFTGSPQVPGTQAYKMTRGRNIVWYEPEWQLKAEDIRKEILEAIGLPIVR